MNDEKLDYILKNALTSKNDESELVIQRRENKKMNKKIVKTMVAVAACAAIMLTGISVQNSLKTNVQNENANKVEKEDSDNKNVVEKIVNSFTITASAAEVRGIEKAPELTFYDTGLGEGGYTGLLFKVDGENIKCVEISVTKGELYRSIIEALDSDEAYKKFHSFVDNGINPFEDPESGDYIMWGLTEYGTSEIYYCSKPQKNISLEYNEEFSYGFYIPDDAWDDSVGDLRKEYWHALDTFDGDELVIKVTFENGEIQEKKYELHTAKVNIENGVVEICEDGWPYGIVATEK